MKHLFIITCLVFLIKPAFSQVTVGDSAINFVLPDTNGNFMSLQDFAGDVIVLNFFAHWCPPCYVEAPMLEDSIWRAYQNHEVTVLGLGHMQSVDNIRFFADSTHVTYPLLRDTAATVFNAYGVPFLPYNFIINQSGYVAHLDGVQGFDIQLMMHVVDSLLSTTSIENKNNLNEIPEGLVLYNAYPNPFNNRVSIKFDLKKSNRLELEIFNIMGESLIREEFWFRAGRHSIAINMSAYSSGIYFYALQTGKDRKVGQFILQK